VYWGSNHINDKHGSRRQACSQTELSVAHR